MPRQPSGDGVDRKLDAGATVAEQAGDLGEGVLGLGEPTVYTIPLDRLGIAYEVLSGALKDTRNRLDQAILALMEGRAGPEHRATAVNLS